MAEDSAAGGSRTVSFGPFHLQPARRLLREGETQVALGGRAMDILITLVDRAGQLVTKDELVAAVWPNTFVEETNLRVNIGHLRRALRDGQDGNRYITTDVGRGYRFVAPVSVSQPTATINQAVAPSRNDRLPGSLVRVIGRESVVAALSAQLPQRRFITLVGPGGIGKTTVALAVARELASAYPGGVIFLDLTPVAVPAMLPDALATVLGLSIPSDNRTPALLAHLRHRQMLLMLDNCEHVIEAAAAMAEEVSAAAPGVHILATSREPLRAAGERVHRLPPLETPTASAQLRAAEALTFPGVQLFVERAAAATGFELSDADAPVVAEICRRLDGIPLAIELATGCIDVFGVRELAARLDDRFGLLMRGRRTALLRHQTLAAALDWSYQLLAEDERRVLRQLAVFAGDFSLDSALAVAHDQAAAQDIVLANLVGKSLVAFDHRGDSARYRLLDSTRLYALAKLRESGELPAACRRHADHYRALFAKAEAECETLPATEWRAIYARHIDNVRAALRWSFSAEGDLAIGIALTINAVPLWVQLSLMGECRTWVEHALAHLDAAGDQAAQARMQLSAALGWSLTFAVGAARATRTAWQTTLELAEQCNDTGYRLRGLWGLWIDSLNNGQQAHALELAQRFAAIVAPSCSTIDLMIADRMLGTSLHFMGDQMQARHHIESMLARYAASAGRRLGARFQFDQQVTAHYFQARILWLLGLPDQATHIVETNVEEALSIGNALSLSNVLGQAACPIALLNGDLDSAEDHANRLLDHAGSHALRLWQIWARCFSGVVMVRRGHADAGVRLLQVEFDAAADTLVLPRFLFLLGEFALCLGAAGEVARGLRTVEAAIARCESSGEGWYLPELWRIKGELARLDGSGAAAEAHFRRAAGLAKAQHARAWQLRAVTGLARLHRDQGCVATAREDLAGIYGGFTEGFATADLRLARATLQELGGTDPSAEPGVSAAAGC
jgi:predicted ATPase/DNA-binding winged helix-turn-helix (wHTH) protein